MKPTGCPYCGVLNDLHDEIDDPAAHPTTGDISICFSCRNVSVFVVDTGPIRLRRPAADELAEFLADPDVRRARAAVAESFSGTQAVQLVRGAGGEA